MMASERDTRDVVGYYLGMEVWVVEDLGGGWVACEWDSRRAVPGERPPGSRKGAKRYRHWATQIKTEPFGDTPVRL